jgi:hypothetical protein
VVKAQPPLQEITFFGTEMNKAIVFVLLAMDVYVIENHVLEKSINVNLKQKLYPIIDFALIVVIHRHIKENGIELKMVFFAINVILI